LPTKSRPKRTYEGLAVQRPLCRCGTRTDRITACDDCDRRTCVYCASDKAWDTSVCDDCRAERLALAEPDEEIQPKRAASETSAAFEEAA